LFCSARENQLKHSIETETRRRMSENNSTVTVTPEVLETPVPSQNEVSLTESEPSQGQELKKEALKRKSIDTVTAIMSTPIQNKRLNLLQKGGMNSPALKIPASPMMARLGYGTGIGVYLMERSPRPTGEIRSPWAIKKIAALKNANKSATKIYAARLEHEASILKQLNHPNIIGFRKFSAELSNPTGTGAYLALETAERSLADLIEARFDEMIQCQSAEMNPNPFPAKNIEKVGLDVSKALNYLHEEMKMIHGDMKSGNVLISGDFEIVKLCDFGVSRKLKEDGTLEGFYVGTEIWNPKEVVQGLNDEGEKKYPITHKVDIFPFGLTLFEMISLKPPHVGTDLDDEDSELDSSFTNTNTTGNRTIELDSSFTDTDSGTGKRTEKSFDESMSLYEERLAERIGTRPSLPDIEFDESYNKILELFYCCTEEDPSKRPTAKHIMDLLQKTDGEKETETEAAQVQKKDDSVSVE